MTTLANPLRRGNPRLSDPTHRSRLRFLRAQLCLDGPWSVRRSYWLDQATIAFELISPPLGESLGTVDENGRFDRRWSR